MSGRNPYKYIDAVLREIYNIVADTVSEKGASPQARREKLQSGLQVTGEIGTQQEEL